MFLEITPMFILAYAISGILAGIIGGMLGLGGGIVIVPILHFLFVQQGFPVASIMHLAVATSLATIIATSASASYAHHRRNAVQWPTVFKLSPGILLGALIGALVADAISSDSLQVLFGLFEILVAIQIMLELKPGVSKEIPATPCGLPGVGVVIGSLSTLLGIGGGALTVPFLIWCNVSLRKAVAISSACGFPIAVAGTISMICMGLDNSDLPDHSLGYLYWPAAIIIAAVSVFFAVIGARLAHVLPVIVLKRIFSIVLLIVGFKMLLKF